MATIYLCLTSHAAPVVVNFCLDGETTCSCWFPDGMAQSFEAAQRLLRSPWATGAVGGCDGQASSGPVGGPRRAEFVLVHFFLKVGTDMCRSHKVSCRNMSGWDEWAKTLWCSVSLYIPRGARLALRMYPSKKQQQWPACSRDRPPDYAACPAADWTIPLDFPWLSYRFDGLLSGQYEHKRRESVADAGTIPAMGPQPPTRTRTPPAARS